MNKKLTKYTEKVRQLTFNPCNEVEWRIYALVNYCIIVQIMACRLFGAKPLSQPVLTYFPLDRYKHILMKLYLIIKMFLFKKMYLKTSSAKYRVIGLNELHENNSHKWSRSHVCIQFFVTVSKLILKSSLLKFWHGYKRIAGKRLTRS